MDKYVFGYFQTMDRARQAAEELKQAGFEVSLDSFSPIGGTNPYDAEGSDLKNPFQAPEMSLAESTLKDPAIRQDSRILRSTHPDASGLAGDEPLSAPENVSLTVFYTHETEHGQIMRILRQFGARE